ncbi:MAG TPA: hypothetical protein VE987_13265 [Polyangiaceae bacterium]|nr:hypothetical protein [Polyangiaceae bacterium]
MNTSQRMVVRNVAYVFAALLLIMCIDNPAWLFGAIAAVGVGMFVWSGRPQAELRSAAGDIVDVARDLQRAEMVARAASEPAALEPAIVERAPTVTKTCRACGAAIAADASRCRECMAKQP